MTRFAIPLLALIVATAPAQAAERGYTVTNFDRIRVEGAYAVTVTSGRSPSARASGSPAALDAVTVRVDGRTLVIRHGQGGWGGFPGGDSGGVTIAVTVPNLVAATVAGSGRLEIDAMRNARVDLSVAGSGGIAVRRLESDRLGAAVSGSGAIVAGGRVATAQVALRGSGRIDGTQLQAADATVASEGSGDVLLAVRRAATVQQTGSGNVRITGKPACTVQRIGSGTVTCG